MKILFYGRTQGNSGPDNVNRAIYAHLNDRFFPASTGKSLRQLWGDFTNLLRCDALVVSGLSRKGCLLTAAAKLMGKKILYLLHGCARWEQQLNGLNQPGPIRQERYLMGRAHRILAVSQSYRDLLAEAYPQYAEKFSCWHPGLPELPCVAGAAKISGTVMAAGGDRPLKNNLPLARAVEALDGVFSLEICGAPYHGDPFGDFRHSRYLGLLPQAEYWEKLRRTEIFVVNSTLESFGVSALEALALGCSLLVSAKAGVRDVLPLTEADIIRDPLDTEELKTKLTWIHDHPNHHRLRPISWTWEDAISRLEALCTEGGSL